MKKRNARILTALLLTLCLLLGSVAALAEEVSVTAGEKDGEVKVEVKDDISSLEVFTYEDGEDGSSSFGMMVNDAFVNDPDNLMSGASDLTVNTGDIITDSANGGHYTEINYDVSGDKSVTLNIDGDVKYAGHGEVIRGSANEGAMVNVNLNGSIDSTADGHLCGIDTGLFSGENGSIAVDVQGDINIQTNASGASGTNLVVFGKNTLTENVGGNITATGSTGDETVGIESWNVDGTIVAQVDGDVVANGKEFYANGMNLHAFEGADTTAIVKGDVIATGGSEGETNGAQAENHGSAILINVGGNVQAKSDEVANGLHLNAYLDADTTVVVKGDVTAEGRDGTGLMIDEILEDASVTVVVEGTLSGSAAAIKTTDVRKESYPGSEPMILKNSAPDVVVWQATENKDGRIAEVYQVVEPYLENPDYDPALDPEHEGWYIDENNEYIPQLILDEDNASYDVDAEASAKLEAAIWYIAKVADSFKATLTATATKKTVDGTDYQVAHENDKVKLTFALDEAEEGLDGILYNAEDKTAAKADEWGKNDDGSYWVKMLRGGGMLLGLNTHKHQKATREENRVEATCAKAGSYDLVTYCTVCDKVLSTEKKTIPVKAHTPAEAVKENIVAATCEKAGSYDEVVYCSACKTELSRKAVAVDKLAHTPAEAVHENIVAAKPGVAGSYDNVVYCSACKTELSREHVATPALPVEKAPAADPAPALEFVYEDVGEDAEVNGVKAADHPEAAEALATVGESLDGEGETVTVEIPGAEKLMDEEELKTFNALPVKDRLLVVLSALGFVNDEQTGATEGMGADAQALSATIAERMANLPEAEKQALLSAIAAEFPKGTVTVDGQAYESFSIDLVIDRNGNKSYERYTFYDENGAWKLYGIEKGVYKEV